MAWPFLSNDDRFLRYAARVAIEFQGQAAWSERALAETNPQAALEAILALIHVSAPDPAHRKATDPELSPTIKGRILAALDKLPWDRLSTTQRLDLVRVYSVLFNRMGRPDADTTARLAARFDAAYPSKSRDLNVELCNLLVYLGARDVAAKTLDLIANAPTQEEQIDLARPLRVLKSGWTPATRKAYFTWLLKANGFKGGASFGGFLANIKRDALATLSESEKSDLKPILEAPAATVARAAVIAPRPHVKDWTIEELTPLVDSGLKQKRDFDRGRNLFAAASCFACHRFDNEGGAAGPDLTGVSGRFSTRDLLESIIVPSKVISDQYGAVVVSTTDGKVVSGRVVNLNNDTMSLNTNMLDPEAQTGIDRKTIEEVKPSPVSMMPQGLINTLNRDDILDLIAYLLSRGDRENPMFR